MKPNKSIAVVYIAYVPFGIDVFEQFLQSYLVHPSGLDHELVIIFKGTIDNKKLSASYQKILAEKKIAFTPLYTELGLDIDTYFFAAKNISAHYFYFLNSSSVLLADNWLSKTYNCFNENIGIVSSTASLQSYYSTVFTLNKSAWENKKGFNFNYKKYKLFLKAFFYWRFLFQKFPNPHFRTNAFLIKKEVFLKIKYSQASTKFDAYQFESGRKSITKQIVKMGLAILVVDKNGNSFIKDKWITSDTFWINNQENLLVADNQTKLYENASADQQKILTKLAWGKNV